MNMDEDELIPRKTFEEFANYADRHLSYLAMLDEQHNVVRISHQRIMEWEEWWKVIENRRVGRDMVNGLLVSTVFLCVDHGFGGSPKWFETMIFKGENLEEALDYQWRYETWNQAREGHETVVELVRNEELWKKLSP
jgi:hypothetical protein